MSDLLYLLAAALTALLLRTFVLSIVRIRGHSMLSTLHDRDIAFVWRLPYLLGRPRRFDVVICRYPGRRLKRLPFLPQSFVKRVIGLPGETLEVIGGVLHIDGHPVPEPFLDPERTRFFRDRPPVTLGPDEYFVMGDNRDSSNDSRRVGPLRRRAIVGRVVCILFPLRRIRVFRR
ncbi:MAG: signal peptidase I [Clostridia bacterium]|nr:signal peptidase I [Clostridia bacterium]